MNRRPNDWPNMNGYSSEREPLIGNNVGNHVDPKPTTDLAIAWLGLKYHVHRVFKRRPKTILNDISGCIDFGTITAIMGPSGAGKTTLLKCLNGRNMFGIDGCTRLFTNRQVEIKSCFIVQEVQDHLLKGLTGLQSITYASRLKNRSKGCKHSLIARKLLMDLMITATANTSVEKCSGGEQKRIAIALELTAQQKPNLLCIDEPTSGLDSYAAEEVINCLKNLVANHDMAVVTSIHQPKNEITIRFDKLYVLAKGGVCIFEGHPRQMKRYLNECGIPMAKNAVPIEVMIKESSREDPLKIQRMADKLREQQDTVLEEKCVREGVPSSGVPMKKVSFSLLQTWYLFSRTVIHIARYRIFNNAFLFLISIMTAFLLTNMFNHDIGRPAGCIDPTFPQNCSSTTHDLRDENYLVMNWKLMFFGTMAIGFLCIIYTCMTFTKDVRLFNNEHKNGWYSSGSYFWSTNIVELPLCVLTSVCYSIILFKTNNQYDEGFRLWTYVGAITMYALTAQGYGLTISIFANADEKLANILAVGLYVFTITMSGFFGPVNRLSPWISWVGYLSFCKQTYEMVLFTLYGFGRCPPGQVSRVLLKLDIVSKHTFYENRNILIIECVVVRLIGLVFLVVKANLDKCEKVVFRVKQILLDLFAKPDRSEYSPI